MDTSVFICIISLYHTVYLYVSFIFLDILYELKDKVSWKYFSNEIFLTIDHILHLKFFFNYVQPILSFKYGLNFCCINPFVSFKAFNTHRRICILESIFKSIFFFVDFSFYENYLLELSSTKNIFLVWYFFTLILSFLLSI